MVPLAVIGVAWGHYIHGMPINMLSWLGIIALVGIMVNDGLVLIGKFNTNLKDGIDFDTALMEAGRSRFRAIFLTSVTTIAGLGPLIFEKSREAQFLIPMAISNLTTKIKAYKKDFMFKIFSTNYDYKPLLKKNIQ